MTAHRPRQYRTVTPTKASPLADRRSDGGGRIRTQRANAYQSIQRTTQPIDGVHAKMHVRTM